jgi:hypothetical protein
MQLTPPYLEADYSEDEDTDFSIPRIDDCDHLYSLTSRDGNSSVYIQVKEFDDGFRAALTVDCEHFAQDIPADVGPFETPESACKANLETARDWFRCNQMAFVYCGNSRKIARRKPNLIAP